MSQVSSQISPVLSRRALLKESYFVLFPFSLTSLLARGDGCRYGDIYPQTELGKGLAIIYIPIAVVFVSTQLSEVGPKLFGASGADTLANLLKVRGKIGMFLFEIKYT